MPVVAARGGAQERASGAVGGDAPRPGLGGDAPGAGDDRVGDERLVDLARAGDRAAFGALFERYAPMVHGILLSRVPAREADDLVQDVFVSALQRLATLREALAFGGWLASIARNRAIDFHRGRKKTTELPDDLAHVDPEQGEAERVLVVIRELPEAYRETLVLRLVEGMSGPEIAERVGITADSVRVNLHRGMKLLREKLEVRGE